VPRDTTELHARQRRIILKTPRLSKPVQLSARQSFFVRLWQFGFDAARSSTPLRSYIAASCCVALFLLFKPLQVSRDVINIVMNLRS
jgi:hypothetical protein